MIFIGLEVRSSKVEDQQKTSRKDCSIMTTISTSWIIMTCRFPEQINLSASHSFRHDSDFHMTFLQKNDGQYRVRPVPKIHGPSWPVPNFALSWPRNPPCFHWKFPWDFWSNVDYQYILLLPEFFLQCTMEICWGFLSGFLENKHRGKGKGFSSTSGSEALRKATSKLLGLVGGPP